MTIIYNLFKIPYSVEDFVDKVKNKGKKSIDVKVWENKNANGNINGSINYFGVGLESGKHSMMIVDKIYGYMSSKYMPELEGNKEQIEKTYRFAKNVARKIEKLGLESTINGLKTKKIENLMEKHYDIKL